MKRALWCGLCCLAVATTAFADNQAATTGAMISLKPVQTNVQPGGTITIDVFISGAVNVGAYQARVAVSGGQKGAFTLQSMKIDRERPDFAMFNSGADLIDVKDDKAGWVGLVRVSGATDMSKPRYVATFTFQASADAAGTFKFYVVEDQDYTFLLDTNGVIIPHQAGEAVQVNVGAPAPERTEGRKKE